MKTRTNLKYAMLAFALVLGISSCSKDDVSGGKDGNVTLKGETTYLAIGFSAPKTYAPHAGTAAESIVTPVTVDVFTYDNAGDLINHQQLSDFASNGSGGWESPTLIESEAGYNDIFVGINLPAAAVTALTAPSANLTTLRNYEWASVTPADIATNNQFVMSSALQNETLDSWDGNGTAPVANQLTIPVARLAAKFTVEEDAALVKTGVDGGEISNLQFGLGQINESAYILQKLNAGVIEDPNYTAPATPGMGLTGAPLPAAYLPVDAPGTAVDALAGLYAPENTNNNTIAGNLTYLSVSATFHPDDYLDSSFSTVTNTNPTGTTFWAVKEPVSGNIYYFYTQADADAYCIADPNGEGLVSGDEIEYTNAACYYTVFLNPTNGYDIYRNEFYKSTIKTITGLGKNAPGPVNPVTPVDPTTYMTVEITVVPWELVDEDIDLTPQ